MTLLIAYTRQRLLTVPVGAAVALVAGGCQLVRVDGLATFARDLIVAGLLVLAFRIWDDLADRERDRPTHPDRVTVRAASVMPLGTAAVLLWTIAAALTLRVSGSIAASVLAAYTAALGIWYARRGSTGTHLILTKYAAFIVVVLGATYATTLRGVSTAIVVYLVACAYEWAHDPAALPSFGGVR